MIQGKVYPVDSARLPVQNPFILIATHVDDYPEGNGKMAPKEFPKDWNKGNDFSSTRGWKMYHGDYVPGFPAHPHRGFETITYAKRGMIDHFDSHGNYGRYGDGDIQWMISGSGMQHAEMFPLLHEDQENPFEIVQIWLNLPSHMKMLPSSYKMHWRENIPVVSLHPERPAQNFLKVLVGTYRDVVAEKPNDTSYGFEESHHINIWDGRIEEKNSVTLPKFPEDTPVQLYVAKGKLKVEEYEISGKNMLIYTSDDDVTFTALEDTEFMVFVGKEIQEEVYAYGPFVMNTRAEILQAYRDFEETAFGGWPWSSSAPTIDHRRGRFSVFDGGTKLQEPPKP